ncbi:MAG: ammonium transporter [Bdellovibrionaceae bacterium]|nr:ammonium transporter [Pseudobdellovibrionaceae bacterium]
MEVRVPPEVTAVVSAGDTAWILISTALVLLMTPGLALFYAGMVRSKNVISTLFKNFAAVGAVGVLWAVVGYSLVFGKTHDGLIGGLEYVLLNGVGQTPNADYAATIPHIAFVLFQCMFAIITPALITGAIVERIRFKAWLTIMVLWALLVYVPVAHWVWGVGGWIRELGALDFAGGLVVHMTAGYSALVIARLLGRRTDIEAHAPHDIGMVILGTALLFFGWFGFNAGSALAANGVAAQAFATTFFAGAGAMVSWILAEWMLKGKPSALGACVGAVAGLVAITPAAGFVTVSSALIIGLITGVSCFLAVSFIKAKFSLDDSLDVFGCHGVGGTIGAILTAVFADPAVNPAGAKGLLLGETKLLDANLLSCGVVALYSMAMTAVIVVIVRKLGPIRVDESAEEMGLDLSQHGETLSTQT